MDAHLDGLHPTFMFYYQEGSVLFIFTALFQIQSCIRVQSHGPLCSLFWFCSILRQFALVAVRGLPWEPSESFCDQELKLNYWSAIKETNRISIEWLWFFLSDIVEKIMEHMLNGSRTRRQVYKHTSVYFVKCCLKERVALELMYRKFTQTHSVCSVCDRK